jgi:site-specific DNA-methyltransferase (adenine-specific)
MIISNVENTDCIAGMKEYPDNFFDLAIVDPPYGLDKKLSSGGGKMKNSPFKKLYKNSSQWDVLPKKEYFDELFRVSRNQIIWGANYFFDYLSATRGVICWDKKQFMPTFSRIEMAWTSFDTVARMYEGTSTDLQRFHPTQKPINLYTWILENYAKQGDKILDTHLGSQSSRIAAYKKGFDFWGFEIDKDYFEQGNERFEKSIAMPLFDAPKELSCSQLTFA